MSHPQSPKHQAAFGFVEETTDDVARKTFKNKDEVQFEKEQSRRRAPKQTEFPVPETGSCCARCRYYRPAPKDDAFGTCRKLGVAMASMRPHVEKGTIVDAIFAFEQFEIESDPLRCKPWAGQGCSAFAQVGGSATEQNREAVAA